MKAPLRDAASATSIAVEQLVLPAHERQPALPLPVGRLDDARRGRRSSSRRGCGTPAASKRSRWRCFDVASGGRRGVDRVRQPHPLGDARRDPDRPVGAGRDDPVDALGLREPVDGRLVLGRDERPLVGVARSPARPGRRSTAITKSSRSPGGAEEARAARRRRLGRGDAVAPSTARHQTSFSRYHATVRSSPRSKLVRARQPVSRSSFSVEPMCRSTWPGRSSTWMTSRVAPRRRQHRLGDVVDRDVDACRHVHDLARDRVDVGGDDRLDRLGVVVHVEPVAARVHRRRGSSAARRTAPA